MPVIYALVIGVAWPYRVVTDKIRPQCSGDWRQPGAHYLSGINVNAKQILVYTAVGGFSALSGILIASRFATAQPAAGTGTELTIMASVIIGGTF